MPVKIEKTGRPLFGEYPQAIMRRFKAKGYDVIETGVMKHALTDEEIRTQKEREEEEKAVNMPMKIKMLITKKGSADGLTVNEYEAGKIYEIPTSLARVFLNEGWAEEIKKGGKK